MTDIKIPPFFWFRPVGTGMLPDGKRDPTPAQLVCFRAGENPLTQQDPKRAMDPPGSRVNSMIETPFWTPPNGGWFHFGGFETMVFLNRLVNNFVADVAAAALDGCPREPNKYGLGALIRDNWHPRGPDVKPKILLGDMTGHGALAVPGHATHSTGQQIDIHYIPEVGSNHECFCGVAGRKKWHVGLNALLLHCILEAGATSVVTDCDVFHDPNKPVKPGPGQKIKRSTRDSAGNIVSDPKKAAQVHRNHFHVDILKLDPRSKTVVKGLYANAAKGILAAPAVFMG